MGITKQKIEAGETVKIHLDKDGLLSAVENILSSIPLPKAIKKRKLLKDPKPTIEIFNQEGKRNVEIEIDAGFFKPKISLFFVLTNAPDNQIQFRLLTSQPETIGGHNVAEKLKQQPFYQYLQRAIQRQLDQQKAGILIEGVKLQFIKNNKLMVTIIGKKRG